jgi:excisionase family DNA binding protein
MGDWLTASEAAAVLQVHPSTVRRWAALGRIQVKMGKPVPLGRGQVLFSAAGVMRLREERAER